MKKLVAAAICMTLTSFSSAAHADFKFKNEADLVAAVMPSFVNIYNRGVASGAETDGVARIQDEVGSGFVVDESGIILTNRHVVEGAYALFVTLNDGTHVPAKLLGKLLTFDLALIKVDVGRPLQVASLGDSDRLRLGDHVVAIGNGLGFDSSVSAGVLSAFHRTVGLSAYDDLMQTDATINQGNSGGPLFNMDGDVIGVNQAIYTQHGGGSIGIGFSIPINAVKAVLANVKKYGKPRAGWLGITGQSFTAGMARVAGATVQEGVIISDLAKNGAAIEAGLQVGDIILKVGPHTIDRMSTLNRTVAMSVDQVEQFQIVRDGKSMTVPVKIKDWPQELWTPVMPAPPKITSLADLGLTFNAAPGPDDPVVANVVEKSIAWSEGIRPGDVIRKVGKADVRSTDDLLKLAMQARDSDRGGALVLVGGPNGTRWVEFSLKE